MAFLHIALQNGFLDDKVLIIVNGKEVYRKSNVNTRLQIGLADLCGVEIKQGIVEVEISLSLKGIYRSIMFAVEDIAYLGISIRQSDKIYYKISYDPFGHL